jgi:hypothetical protein
LNVNTTFNFPRIVLDTSQRISINHLITLFEIMRPFQVLDTEDLVKVLAEYTARYTKMLTDGAKERDLINCKETIRSLIDEMASRKASPTSHEPSAMNR